MTTDTPQRVPDDALRLAAMQQAQEAINAYKAFLANPAFVHRIDLAVLTKIAGDDTMPVRERRRAAEVLGRLYVQALEKVAELTCAKEQMLKELGLEAGPKAVAVAQINQRIEIVRHDDWRDSDA